MLLMVIVCNSMKKINCTKKNLYYPRDNRSHVVSVSKTFYKLLEE